MKVIDNETGCRVIELTRRNLQALPAKLDDPLSARALVDPDDKILVRAVESSGDRGDAVAQAALAAEGVFELFETNSRRWWPVSTTRRRETSICPSARERSWCVLSMMMRTTATVLPGWCVCRRAVSSCSARCMARRGTACCGWCPEIVCATFSLVIADGFAATTPASSTKIALHRAVLDGTVADAARVPTGPGM